MTTIYRMILYISVYLCLHLFSCVKFNVINYYPHLPQEKYSTSLEHHLELTLTEIMSFNLNIIYLPNIFTISTSHINRPF
nr:MAG TPA: hypothetical protein [Bacteriophage sp.]